MKIFLCLAVLALALPLQAQTPVTNEPAFRDESGHLSQKIINPELRALVRDITTNWIAGRTNAADITKEYICNFMCQQRKVALVPQISRP